MPQDIKPQLDSIIEKLKAELTKLRTARANPALVEDIPVTAYGGSRMPIKELASISVPEPRTIVIKPWDKGIIKDIEKGLIQSALEFNPVVETEVLRIQLPELTQETREKLVKKLREMLENQRIKMRTIRDDTKKTIESQEKAGELSQDDKYSAIEELNKVTRQYADTIEDLGKTKEKEIMTI